MEGQMSFTFIDDEPDETEVWQCTECGWLSAKRHFRENSRCTLCRGTAEHIETITDSDEMPAFQYQQLLSHLSDNVSGVGDATIANIRDEWDDGDDFLSVCEDAYQEQAYEPLTVVSGIGESTAESIALGIAEKKGWEGGKAEVSFSIA
jgi:hypothetical protein